MTTPEPVPTVAKESAYLAASGLVITVAGFVLLLVSGFEGVTNPQKSEYSANPGLTLFWIALVALVGGVSLLSVGVFRFFQHADRAAGVRFSRRSVNS